MNPYRVKIRYRDGMPLFCIIRHGRYVRTYTNQQQAERACAKLNSKVPVKF